ncbi:MAG: hypothetical protein WAX04_04680 [Oscillospiraceae bacterium]
MNSTDCIQLVRENLLSKIDFFSQYEEITNKMLTCDTEQLSDYIIERQNLVSQIDVINQRLYTLYSQSNDAKLKQAALNQLNCGECPEQLKDVFFNGQKLSSIVSRILRKEEQVVSRVETQKEILLNLIREQNTGVTANAEKYYRTLKQFENNYTIFNNKY